MRIKKTYMHIFHINLNWIRIIINIYVCIVVLYLYYYEYMCV